MKVEDLQVLPLSAGMKMLGKGFHFCSVCCLFKVFVVVERVGGTVAEEEGIRLRGAAV